jgi:hypothetical protein
MYKFLCIIIISILICSNSYAQKVSNKILTKYPHAVVINMYNDVLSKFDISEDLQIKLASMYVKRDSLIFKQLSSPSKSINYNRYGDSLLYSIEIQFKKLLDSVQKKEYFLKVERARAVNFPIVQDTIKMDIEMDSQLGLALALYEKFNLKPKQKDSLIYYATLLKQWETRAKLLPDSGYFDKAAFESETISKILTEQEYNGLLSIKNKTVAENYSKHTWYQLRKDNLIPADYNNSRDTTLATLKLFYLTKATLWDKLANKPEYRNIVMQQIKVPPVLLKALTLRNNTQAKLEKYNW